MKSVTVRQAKYFMDKIKRNDLPYLKLNEHQIFDKVLDSIESNKVYVNVGKKIEDEAHRLVKELQPKTDEIALKINELNKEYSEESKKENNEEKLNEIKKQLNALGEEYDKVYQDTQKALDDYKIKVIVEENRGVKIMDIKNNEYDTIDNIIHWTIDESIRESVADKLATDVETK